MERGGHGVHTTLTDPLLDREPLITLPQEKYGSCPPCPADRQLAVVLAVTFIFGDAESFSPWQHNGRINVKWKPETHCTAIDKADTVILVVLVQAMILAHSLTPSFADPSGCYSPDRGKSGWRANSRVRRLA